ncbi:MAG: hypothetical protein ACK46X_16865 [Candidatus Sericytochromatia bacterium]
MLHRTITGSVATVATLLALGLTGCGQVSPAPVSSTAKAGPVEARVSPAARDKMCQMLIKEYQGIQWYQDAEKKQMLLEAVVATGSDLAVDLLIKEYEGIQWYQDKARKMMFLDLIKQLASAPTHTKESVTDDLEATAKGPTRKALYRAAESLKKDLPDAPTEAKAKIKEIISKVQIIAPNTGR